MILYFTGTGNSRFVAERIASSVGDKAVNISTYIKGNTLPRFSDTGVYVFVAPCYVSTTAMSMFDFIMSASFPKGVRAYFIITSASYMGAAPATNRYLAKKKGFEYMGTENVVMPQNYIVYFKTKTKKEQAPQKGACLFCNYQRENQLFKSYRESKVSGWIRLVS